MLYLGAGIDLVHLKMVLTTILVFVLLNAPQAQYRITASPLPEKINSPEVKRNYYAFVSPDGSTLVYSSGLYYLTKRTAGQWSDPITIPMLNNIGHESGRNNIKGFNGKTLYFNQEDASIIYKSDFINNEFTAPIPWDYRDISKTEMFWYNLGNPNKFFYSDRVSNGSVYEVYFNNTTIKNKVPDRITRKGIGIFNCVPIGNNGLLYRNTKQREFNIVTRNTSEWSIPFRIKVDIPEEKNKNIWVTSYSEETHEVFFSIGHVTSKIYSATLPEDVIKLINTDYPSNSPTVAQVETERNPETIDEAKPKYYALLIGIEDYQNNQANLVDLSKPISDAISLKTELTENYTFKDENITILQNPKRADIINSFEKISNQLTEKDNLLIFYAGHGIWDEKLNIGYWLSSDATIQSKANWISNSTIRDYIAGLSTKHTLLISDACFSGSIFKTREVTKSIDDYGYYRLNKLPSRKAMTSGTLNTVPDESKFMKYLLKALSTNEKEYFPSKQLFHEIEIAIINNTTNIPQFGTIQNTGDEGGDFIFIKREKE